MFTTSRIYTILIRAVFLVALVHHSCLISYSQGISKKPFREYLNKIGGSEKVQSIKSYRIEAKIYSDGRKSKSTQYFQKGDSLNLMRIDKYDTTGFNTSSFFLNGKQSVAFNNFQGFTEALEGYQERIMFNQRLHSFFDNSILLLEAFEKDRLTYLGLIDFRDQNYYTYSLSSDDIDGEMRFCFDTETLLLVAFYNPTGSQGTYRTFGDYREVDGLLTPYRLTNYRNDLLYEQFDLLKMEINPEQDPDIFNDTR